MRTKTTHQIRLSIKGSELQISSEDLDFANGARRKIELSISRRGYGNRI